MSATQLDTQQSKAVATVDGLVLIVAGPGSGKTRVLVERTQYLITECHRDPSKILLITFTTKAAQEIRERLSHYAIQVQVFTLHALAYQQLIQHGYIIQLDQPVESLSFDPASNKKIITNFEELLIEFNILLKTNLQISENFDFIMVDEAQDMTALQLSIIDHLAQAQGNLCLIGDPDQTIYGFRGADSSGLIKFIEHYPLAQIITLDTNYRCPENITQASQSVIQHNQQRFSTLVQAVPRLINPLITITTAQQAYQEAHNIIATIEQLLGGTSHSQFDTNSVDARSDDQLYHFNDIVVLYRLNTIGDTIEKYFIESGLPYQRVGEIDFFERKEIRELLQTFTKIIPTVSIVQELHTIIEQKNLVQRLKPAHYDRVLELLNIASWYDHLSPDDGKQHLLQHAQLARDTDYWNPQRDAITLMTIHAAKGLEFPVVFLAGVEENILPHMRPDTLTDIKEERRLFYVAITRVQERLYISHSKQRTVYGQQLMVEPSRFLQEIPQHYTNHITMQTVDRKKKPQMKLL